MRGVLKKKFFANKTMWSFDGGPLFRVDGGLLPL
jgi:hypothetical protein